MIDGRQYVAIETGWGGDVTGTQAALNRLVPGDYPPVPTGGAVYMFAVE
jgi:alcohol dehydrogenase (cytochrome c)